MVIPARLTVGQPATGSGAGVGFGVGVGVAVGEGEGVGNEDVAVGTVVIGVALGVGADDPAGVRVVGVPGTDPHPARTSARARATSLDAAR